MWLCYLETPGGDPENKPAENPGETEGARGAEKSYRISQGEFRAEEQLLAAEELFETRLGLSSSHSQSVRSQCWSSFSPNEAHCGEQAVRQQ